MICWINCLNKFLFFLLVLVSLTGTVRGEEVVEAFPTDTGWKRAGEVHPGFGRDALLAYLPPENLSGVRAPVTEIGRKIMENLRGREFRLLEETELESFMKKYRMRHTGGIGSRMGRLLRDETGARAVFVTSLESFQEQGPPKISLICRIVTTGLNPEIVWIKSVGLSGDQSPGFLGLGLIDDSEELIDMAVEALLDDLDNFLHSGFKSRSPASLVGYEPAEYGDPTLDEQNPLRFSHGSKYDPREYYRASWFNPEGEYAVAVVPFLNKYARAHAGFVAALHFTEILHGFENLHVFEPGLVREQLLRYRLIMPAGPSLAVSDVLASRTTLSADLILSGQVFDYQGLRGVPKVDFSVQIFDGPARDVAWWSRSDARGDKNVYFFDFGRIHTAHGLMHRLADRVGAMFLSH
jgi:hypothetical protein